MGARFYFVTMIGVDLAGKLVKSCTKSFVARMHLNGLEREREREREMKRGQQHHLEKQFHAKVGTNIE